MKKFLLKLSGVAAAAVFALTAITPASAQTVAELQALIMQLQAQLAALTGQQPVAAHTYTRDLTIGSTGSDVVALQTFLQARGHLVMPAGVSMGYFGPITRSALARYQATVAISPAVGYFGPITRAHMNAMVVIVPGTPTTPTTPSTGLQGGAGDLVEVRQTTSGTETTVGEGREERVLAMDLEADNNSDLEITSIRVTADVSGGTGSNRLNRYVDEAIIYMGNREVGSVSTSAFSRSGTLHTATISLDNAIIRQGRTERFYVAFVANNVIDSVDQGKTISVAVDRIRFEDASGAILTESPSNISTTVSFEDATVSDDLRLQASPLNPNATTLRVEENTTTSNTDVFAFRLRAGTDSSDVVVTQIPVRVDITNPTGGEASVRSENVITDISLRVGSRTYRDFTHTNVTVADGTTATATYLFDIDEGDLEIGAGDTEDVVVSVRFGRQDGRYDTASTIRVSVVAADVEAENIRGDRMTLTGGTVVGNVHSLQLESVNFELTSASVVHSSEAAGVNPFVTVTQALRVEADETLYIEVDPSASLDIDVTGGTSSSSTFVSGSNSPNIVTVNGVQYYEISGTRTLYVRTIINGNIGGTAQNVRIQLNTVTAATTPGGATATYTLAPASNFATDTTLRY